MGLDIKLMQYQAYRTGQGEVLITVSQLYPVPEVAAFENAPRSRAGRTRTEVAPIVPWAIEDLATLAEIGNATTLAILDLGAQRPDEWIPASDVYEHAGVTMPSGTGQLGGFGLTLRSRFNRGNPPFERQWGANGHQENCYLVSSKLAQMWTSIRSSSTQAKGGDAANISAAS